MESESKGLGPIDKLLIERERDRREIERLTEALKVAEARADKAEGRLRHYEGPGMAYAD